MTDASIRSVIVEREVPYPPEKIWRALTRAPLIAEWRRQNDFEPRLGHRFNFRATPSAYWNGVTDCEVLEVSPPDRLVYSWNASGEQAAGGLKTIVTWTLTPAAGGTRVRMEQSGFRPEDENGFRAMGGGWPRIVARLGDIAAKLD